MNRDGMLLQLNKVTDKAASIAIRESMPIPGKRCVYVGSMFIEKNKIGYYDVFGINTDISYLNIAVFDVAIIVAQRYNNKEYTAIKKVLALEDIYSKNHTEMIYFLHCYKGAKSRKDYVRMSILEDKFSTAESKAKNARDKISYFKRVK